MYVWLLIATPYWTFWSLEGEWQSPTRSFAGQVFQMLLWRFVAARTIGRKSGRGPGYLLVQEWSVLLLSLALAAVRKFIVTELKWLTLCIYIYIYMHNDLHTHYGTVSTYSRRMGFSHLVHVTVLLGAQHKCFNASSTATTFLYHFMHGSACYVVKCFLPTSSCTQTSVPWETRFHCCLWDCTQVLGQVTTCCHVAVFFAS